MQLCDLNPYLRFAAEMLYDISYNATAVRVSDCRLFFILSGQAELLMGDRCYSLRDGDLFYCCAGSRYSIHTRDSLRLISLNFDLTQAHNHQSLPLPPCREPGKWDTMEIYRADFTDSPFLNGHLFLQNVGHLQGELQVLLEEFGAAGPYCRELCSATLKRILIRLHQADPQQIPPMVDEVQRYIQDNYALPLTNRSLAQLAGYHPYYLNRVFSECTGMSLHEYVLQVRLRNAIRLILNTGMDLQDIAEQVGFGSYPHFSSYFRQKQGCSPAQYRKRLRANI